MDAERGLMVHYIWEEGTVPPPHYYEYAVVLGPMPEGRITLRPGYAFQSPPAWEETFAVAPAPWNALVQQVEVLLKTDREPEDATPKPVGGSTHTLRIMAGERTIPFTSYGRPEEPLAAAIDAVHAAVPKVVWDAMQARRERFSR